jgi:DNA-directed RNA polymerase subunit RPC12/RpoP
LLAAGAVEGEKVELTHCLHCSSPVLMDRLSTPSAACPRCKRIVRKPS